jgi:hypothetical protein
VRKLLRQMQTNIYALIILYVDRNFFGEVKRSTVLGFDPLEIRAHNVIVLTGKNTLRELAAMIGIKLPLRLFVGSYLLRRRPADRQAPRQCQR